MQNIKNHSWYYGPVIKEGHDEGIGWQPEEYVAEKKWQEAKDKVLRYFSLSNVV